MVAGPPGGGKSSVLRVADLGLDTFNADDRAAQLHGSYHGIPLEIRASVNKEFEQFIQQHIRDGRSLAYETTLRTTITYDQARAARKAGFETELHYVALTSPELHIERVIARAKDGEHSAPPERIREIYEASLRNLPKAFEHFDNVQIYDNSGKEPALLLVAVDRTPSQ